ncbi:MAG: hypothetical protein U0871_25945 [Gemmataceae bacterium]
MRREEVDDLFRRVPEADHTKVVIVLAGGQAVSVETVFQVGPDLLIVRGREVGSNDEGRAFFLPYPIISFVKMERLVRLEELAGMFTGGQLPAAAPRPAGTSAPASAPATPPPAGPVLDPTAIAKQNLLERLRAARTSGGSPVFGKK